MRAVFMIAFAAILSSTGCATLVTGGGHSQTVRLNSEPRGANVYVDGNLIGKTPTVATLSRKDNHTVRMEMEGCEPQTRYIKTGPNLWTFGNFIAGGLIGFTVDACSGSWEGLLNPNDVVCKFMPAAADKRVAIGPEPATGQR